MTYRPVTLIILDGWGLDASSEYSAEAKANIPYYKSLLAKYPNTSLSASGEEVGLPEGQMGNSEVGHLNIGAGRIVYQDYTRINLAVRDGSINSNPALCAAMDRSKSTGRTLHLMGLLSDGGVHSDIRQLFALLKMAHAKGVTTVRIHAFMDGRDTPPRSGLDYMQQLESFIINEGMSATTRVATVSGRYYAMDRDTNWDRVEKAYRAVVMGEGRAASTGSAAMDLGYAADENDEFILPTVITEGGLPVGPMQDGDCVIFFNFRTDRTREITHAIALDRFDGFVRAARPELGTFVCMTEYDQSFDLPVAFPPQTLDNILGEVLSAHGKRQLRIAETEKYAHVTFFFNGGAEIPFTGEDRVLIPSPKDVATYDLKPQMSAYELTDEIVARIRSGVYDVIIVNYANPDMVGHTGIMAAAVKACEVVDACLARIVPEIQAAGGVAFITADHGNAEKMYDPETGAAHTAHTSNKVPFIMTDAVARLNSGGKLADIAPTLLDVMGIDKPVDMTGASLIA